MKKVGMGVLNEGGKPMAKPTLKKSSRHGNRAGYSARAAAAKGMKRGGY